MSGIIHTTRLITILVLVFCVFLTITHANFDVKTIYFRPTDAPAFSTVKAELQDLMLETQEVYANELERHGFERKLFNLQMDGNRPWIHHVGGQYNTSRYATNTWESILAELPNSLKNNLDDVRVIFIGGMKKIEKAYTGLGGSEHSGNYGGSCIIAHAAPEFSKQLIFHEMSHCFGLFHQMLDKQNEIILHNGLELMKYEARWLSKHYHFRQGFKQHNVFPTITSKSVVPGINNTVTFTINADSSVGLHQAQLITKNDHLTLLYFGQFKPVRTSNRR